MRTITLTEALHVSGAALPIPSRNMMIAMGASGLVTGTFTAGMSSVLSPIATLAGTLGSTALSILVCKPLYSPEYVACCGTAGAIGGYLFSAAVVHTAIVVGGFAAGAGGFYYYALTNRLL